MREWGSQIAPLHRQDTCVKPGRKQVNLLAGYFAVLLRLIRRWCTFNTYKFNSVFYTGRTQVAPVSANLGLRLF